MRVRSEGIVCKVTTVLAVGLEARPLFIKYRIVLSCSGSFSIVPRARSCLVAEAPGCCSAPALHYVAASIRTPPTRYCTIPWTSARKVLSHRSSRAFRQTCEGMSR